MTVMGEHLEKTSVPLPDGKNPNGTPRDPTLRGSRPLREPKIAQPSSETIAASLRSLSMTHLFAGPG